MSIRFNCPNCQGVIEAREELIGSQALCPFCRKILKVVKPETEPAAAAPTPAPAPPKQEAPAPTPPPEPKPVETVNIPSAALAVGDEPVPHNTDGAYQYMAKPASAPPEPAPSQNGPPEATLAPSLKEGPVGLVLGADSEHRQRRNRFLIILQSLFRRGNPTEVSLVLTGIAAAAITWLGYFLIVQRLPAGTYIRELLAERSWVQYATVYFTMWAAVVLAVKYWKIATQQMSLSYDLLPVDRATKITPENANLIEHHINRLPLNPRKSFLINRILMALENFKARKSVPEVGALLNAQGETDAAIVDSSYAMLKVLIWCIPILGFIGTVIGISQAVNKFDKGIQAENADIAVIKSALGEVTNGLAVAFDTTYLGLILSMVIMFPTNSVQKAEEDLLSEMDQFCNENLLPRLATEEETHAGPSHESDALRLMREHQASLQAWQKRLEYMETVLMEKVVDTLGEVRKELGKKNKTVV